MTRRVGVKLRNTEGLFIAGHGVVHYLRGFHRYIRNFGHFSDWPALLLRKELTVWWIWTEWTRGMVLFRLSQESGSKSVNSKWVLVLPDTRFHQQTFLSQLSLPRTDFTLFSLSSSAQCPVLGTRSYCGLSLSWLKLPQSLSLGDLRFFERCRRRSCSCG